MASTIGKLLFALALFFFFLAFIFVIVAYSTFWLVPRDNYTQDTDRVDGVGLKRACFTEFIFPLGLDPSNFEINGCYDNTRDSPTFARIKNIDVWSPRWFQTVQDMHLGCIIMMVFNLLFFGGFLAIYFYAEYRKRKEKELSPCLIIMKCGLALWFIFTLVIGLLLLVEPILFYTGYSRESSTFYRSDHGFNYGPGFGLTIGAAVSMLISGGIGIALFCGIVKHIIKTLKYPQSREDDYYSQDDSQYSPSEVDGLSQSDEQQVRKDPDGVDESEVVENFQGQPTMRDNRKSTTSLSKYASGDEAPDSKPVPAPRRSVNSTPVQPSPERQSYSGRDVEMRYSASPSSGSQAPSVRSVRPMQFQYDFKPGQGYVPKTSARPTSDVESQYSAANQRASLSPRGPPPAGGKLYVPPSRSSYAGSAYTDTESLQSDRNRSVSRSSPGRQPAEPPVPMKVVKPKTNTSAKHSRYAASGW